METPPRNYDSHGVELFWGAIHDTWFITALGSTVISASETLNIITESNINRPIAGTIVGAFAVAAVASGRKAWNNFVERRAASNIPKTNE